MTSQLPAIIRCDGSPPPASKQKDKITSATNCEGLLVRALRGCLGSIRDMGTSSEHSRLPSGSGIFQAKSTRPRCDPWR